jgi:hypothetical protein
MRAPSAGELSHLLVIQAHNVLMRLFSEHLAGFFLAHIFAEHAQPSNNGLLP